MVAHVCNTGTKKQRDGIRSSGPASTEEGVLDQPGLHETLSQNNSRRLGRFRSTLRTGAQVSALEKKASLVTELGRQTQEDPGAHLPSSLAESMSAR